MSDKPFRVSVNVFSISHIIAHSFPKRNTHLGMKALRGSSVFFTKFYIVKMQLQIHTIAKMSKS